MQKCPNCNAELADNASFCEMCGTKLDQTQQNFNQDPNYQQDFNQQQTQGQPNFYQQPPQNNQPGYGLNTTGITVWSVLNLLFCCLPLGIWGLILALTLKNAPTYEEAIKKMKQAKTINIIATVVGAVVNIIYVIMYVVIIAGSMSTGFYY